MDDSAEIKEETNGSEFDAFTDGTTIVRRYRLREPKPKKTVKAKPVVKKSIKRNVKPKDGITYPCTKCTKSFDSKTGLLNHLRMHDVVRKYTCALCQTVFDTNEELKSHKAVHKDDDRVFVCKICKVAFTDHCDFLVHDYDHVKKKTHKCQECAMYFDPHYIKLHIQTHFDRSVKCDVCGKTYQGANQLKIHMKTHDPANLLECGECGRTFKEKHLLNYHMVSHTGVKAYQCLYCGIGFSNNGQRKVHMHRKHTTDRPHQCNVCDSKFKTKGDLKLHLITHDTEKKIECNVCGKKFFHKQSLMFHRRLHTKEDMFECPECDTKCPTRQSLRTHVLYKHMDVKDFECELCEVSFKTLKDIKRHNNSKAHKRAEYGVKLMKEAE